jgi:hypothetical protein
MRILARPTPRPDPRVVYAVAEDWAKALSVDEIAAKHNLTSIMVRALLRPAGQTGRMCTPFQLGQGELPPNAAVQVYWLGYIAAAGRVFGHGTLWTLVLAIHPDDEPHIKALLDDLVVGHAAVEYADSSLEGRQVYIRDRELVETLLAWGLGAPSEHDSTPLEFIPHQLVSDFVRGYLEGSRQNPPFGGPRARVPAPGTLRSLVIAGRPALIAALRRALEAACGVKPDVDDTPDSAGRTRMTFSKQEGLQVLASAYARPARTGPRASAYAAWFARRTVRGRRAGSNGAG